jgi:quercetin dioxygenase-like cupin family protein
MQTQSRPATVHIRADAAPAFSIPGMDVTGLAAPSRGATETSAWRSRVAPGSPGAEHSVDREELFLALAGSAVITVDGAEHRVSAGDALVVPAGSVLRVANPHADAFEAITVLPVGGRVSRAGAEPFVPPWAS